MSEWFASGRVIDLALAVIGVEALVLTAMGRVAGRPALLATLAAGACLLLALRSALTSAPWGWTAAALTAALAAHAADLYLRLHPPQQ